MKKKRKLLPGYTLLEMLIVMGIFIILGALGVGGYIGTRETLVARENIEVLKQDIRSARLKAMLLKKGIDSNWLYGIGIDFSQINNGTYKVMKWCSPFEDFGNAITRSKVLGWDSGKNIGDGSPPVLNGYLPTALPYTDSCVDGQSTLSLMTGDNRVELIKVKNDISIIGETRYLIFEALTGRAFFYDTSGKPLNYELDGDYIGGQLLDIVLTRRRSSKYDVLSIYPESGLIIHHIYSNADKNQDCESNCIELGGAKYKRYGIMDEINSYREQ